ncbi:lipid kinase, YegS/Rv2252/BmrU family [Nakamurella panacisegetis]|uniref:Lipid kinase, YegS/Rv2252/BmrU family n=1 Tax=Nakamurella panacisegetis TaxID=1090615 RepID=A0A1H0QNK8_9ACTN|nr:diacylglycerol kinase family protein [Nakamurella panacisegetis]SDP18842.1 lipid kinase, YegS/Rv2252/BmrU family [Nakamurella panacisegetis]
MSALDAPVAEKDVPSEVGWRTAVVANPARVADLSRRRQMIEEVLADAGWPAPSWSETTPEDPGTGQARRAVAAGARVVFACGGDGTVRAVIAGMLDADAALAVLPAGTGNLLAANLNLPEDPAQVVRLVIAGERRRLDLGQVDGQVFAVMAGMGFDAAMMDDASDTLKARFGPVAYVFSALRHLRDRPMRLEIDIDDRPTVRCRARSVLVGNVGTLQGGVRLLPNAEPDSGSMEVAILQPHHLGHWLGLAAAVVLRRRTVPRMTTWRGSRINVRSDRTHPRQLDGDVIEPSDTLSVSVIPGGIAVCVPPA